MSAAEIDAALSDVHSILVDTSTLIAFHSPHEQAHPLAKHLMGRVERDDDALEASYSVISAAEILVRPLRVGPEPFAFMHTFLTSFPHLSLLPIDLPVAIQAAALRANTGLRVPDAFIIASGLLAGCQAIVTNDRAWKKRLDSLFREFKWVYLSDHL